MSDAVEALPPIVFEPLSEDPGGAFRCGEPEIDRWFKSCFKKHRDFKHRVTAAYFENSTRIIGFYALSVRMESDQQLTRDERILFGSASGKFVAVGFDYVAVRQDLRRKGIGTVITGKVIDDFAHIASMCGIEFLIGSAIDRAAYEGFYQGMGFKQYGLKSLNRPQMFLPAQSAIELVNSIADEGSEAAQASTSAA